MGCLMILLCSAAQRQVASIIELREKCMHANMYMHVKKYACIYSTPTKLTAHPKNTFLSTSFWSLGWWLLPTTFFPKPTSWQTFPPHRDCHQLPERSFWDHSLKRKMLPTFLKHACMSEEWRLHRKAASREICIWILLWPSHYLLQSHCTSYGPLLTICPSWCNTFESSIIIMHDLMKQEATNTIL